MQEFYRLLSDIQNGVFKPFYLLSGTEPFFIDQIVTEITNRIINESAQDFDHTVFYGKEVSVADIVEAAKRYPMIANHHLVVVKEAQNISKDLDELAAYAERPFLQTVLVFCCKYKLFDKRKKLYKAVQKSGEVVEFKALYDNQMGDWIQNRGKALGLELSVSVSTFLAECLGADLSKTEMELKKLKLATKPRMPITKEVIEEYIGFSKDFNNFELQNAIGSKQFSKAYQIVKYMSNNPKKNPLTLTISTLHSFFQKLLIYHGLPNTSKSASELEISPYFVKNYQRAAQSFDMRQTGKVLSLLSEADLKSKGILGYATDHEGILNDLLIKIFAV